MFSQALSIVKQQERIEAVIDAPWVLQSAHRAFSGNLSSFFSSAFKASCSLLCAMLLTSRPDFQARIDAADDLYGSKTDLRMTESLFFQTFAYARAQHRCCILEYPKEVITGDHWIIWNETIQSRMAGAWKPWIFEVKGSVLKILENLIWLCVWLKNHNGEGV